MKANLRNLSDSRAHSTQRTAHSTAWIFLIAVCCLRRLRIAAAKIDAQEEGTASPGAGDNLSGLQRRNDAARPLPQALRDLRLLERRAAGGAGSSALEPQARDASVHGSARGVRDDEDLAYRIGRRAS